MDQLENIYHDYSDYADSFQAMEQDARASGRTQEFNQEDWFDEALNRRLAMEAKGRREQKAVTDRAAIKAAVVQLGAFFYPPQPKGAMPARSIVMSEPQELAVVPPAETALQVYSTPNGLEPWLQQVRIKVDEFKQVLPELTTKKGRDAYKSMAHRIAKSKNALEDAGKKLSAEQKEIPKKIDAERKRVWDILESWQKEVRQPLDDWQAAEDKRIDDHQDALKHLRDMAVFATPPLAAHVEQIIQDVQMVTLDDSWEEFLPEAGVAKDQVLFALRTLLTERQQHEAQQREIARLRAEADARVKADRDAAIALAAAEQERQAAEQRAQAERDAAAQREQVLANAAREAKEASERQALQLRLQEQEAAHAAEQAERDRVAAEHRRVREVEEARQAEIQRQAEAAAEQQRLAEAREADKEHKGSINRTALAAFTAAGMPEEFAKLAVVLIASRKIPAVSIAY